MRIQFVERNRMYRRKLRAEFFSHIKHLLTQEQVLRLDGVKQHYKYTRLRHSIDVAYRSFLIAKLLKLNERSVARAGLLHDLFFLAEGQNSRSLFRTHPRIALENARCICELTPMEEDIIKKHMWLATIAPPSYREGYLVTLVDKYSAASEFLISLFIRGGLRTAAPLVLAAFE